MKSLVFDTGPLISLSLNNILDILEKLKPHYGGKFLITPSVKKEAVGNPLHSKKYKFEAIQLLEQIKKGIIDVYTYDGIKKDEKELLDLANHIFKAHDNYIKIVHSGEIQALAVTIKVNADAFIVDEFVTRALIENPKKVKRRLEKKLHTKVYINEKNLVKFKNKVKDVKVIRSVELIIVAYELGLLDEFKLLEDEPDKNLLDAVLWGCKLNGCSITRKEIFEIMKLEGF